MDDVNVRDRDHLRQVQAQGLQRNLELLLGALADQRPRLRAVHVQVALVGSLIAPAMHFHFDLLRQLAAQVFHMHAGPAVDIGRVFARHQAHSHSSTPATQCMHWSGALARGTLYQKVVMATAPMSMSQCARIRGARRRVRT